MSGPTILHLGIGAFHRAHQAVMLQRLHELGDRTWRLIGGDLRDDQPDVVAALAAQQGRYTVEAVAPDATRTYQTVTAIAQVIGWQPGHAALVDAGADPATRIVPFTVTEAGYFLAADDGLDATHPDIAADLAAAARGDAGQTLYGVLAAIARERRRRDAGPLTLLCCDNLRHGGTRSRAALLDFLACAGDDELRRWVQVNTSSPDAMVDRITPRPPPELRERVRAATGVDDRVAVMCEDYLQWVIEDRFVAGRPAWETAGALLVESVTPYEEGKIRLLNASHSALAWGGALRGHGFIHDAVRDRPLRALVEAYARDDAIPCLLPSPLDLHGYVDSVLDRFGNAALADTVARVAADSFAKLPGFVVPTIRDRLGAGASIAQVAVLPALLLAFLQRWDAGALPFAHVDRAMDPEVARAICRADDPLAALCAEPALFADIAGEPRLLAAVRAAARKLGSEYFFNN